MARRFSIHSDLAAHTAELWDHAVSPVDVNAELRPLLSMSFPDGVEDITTGWEPGRFRFRSWILLGGLIPVEYDDIAFAEVQPGHSFCETSSMASQSLWSHERVVEALPGGARISDHLTFAARLPMLEPLYGWVFRWVFQWRHYNLRRRYGNLVASAARRQTVNITEV